MNKKNMTLTRAFFVLISILVIVVGRLSPNSNGKTLTIGSLIMLALIILDIKFPTITNLSEDNPKIKTMRFINRLTMGILLTFILFTSVFQMGAIFSERTNKILVVGFFSVFMIIFGNLSPKIPFNRYLGLRLPWTIRDEDTWKIAHRILGYISFPIAILQFIFVFFFQPQQIIPISILIWIIVPGLYSLWFFYRKFKNI